MVLLIEADNLWKKKLSIWKTKWKAVQRAEDRFLAKIFLKVSFRIDWMSQMKFRDKT